MNIPISVLNKQRAARFVKAIESAYGQATDENIMDLLSDCMHLCKLTNMNFDALNNVATEMFYRDLDEALATPPTNPTTIST